MTRLKRFAVLVLPLAGFACAPRTQGNLPGVAPPPDLLSPPAAPPAPSVPPPVLGARMTQATPGRGKLFTFAAREAPLREVLEPLAAEMSLGIGWERGVDASTRVSVNFQNVTLDEALEAVLAGTDYFYHIEPGHLRVKLTETRFFELGYVPSRVTSEMSVGGDVLGEIGDTGPSGKFQVAGGTDPEAADLWKQVEEGLRFLLSENGKYSINRLSGTVIVTDNRKHLEHIASFFEETRRALGRQVVVDVKVVEVGLDERSSHGIDWSGLLNVAAGKNSVILSAGQTLGLPNPLFQMAVDGKNGSLVLNALSEQGDLNVISQPRLNILNGQTAVINVGRVIVYWELQGVPGGSLGGQGVVVPEQRSVLAGILMGVTPFIGSDGYVTLQVVPIITDLGEMREFEFQGARLQAPDLNIRGASTTVGVRSGETVIIGGLLSTKKKNSVSKIPLLGDVPWLGNLFKREVRESSKVELALLLTPQVVNRN